MNQSVPVKSVQKALGLLDQIVLEDVTGHGVALAELAKTAGIPLNTAHNLLKSLVACGYVALNGRGVYVAGAKCRQMGLIARFADAGTRSRLLAELQRLVDEEGEACVCTILVNGARVMVGSVDSTHAVRVAHATIESVSFFGKATGRMLAATADAEERREILERQGLPGPDWDGIADETSLQQALESVRADGYCLISDQEFLAIGCPVFRADGKAWGALGIYAPAYRCSEERRLRLLQSLLNAAKRVETVIN